MDIDKARAYNAKHAANVTPNSPEFALLVEGWQRWHKLGDDGMLGPSSRSRLVVPASSKLDLSDVAPRADGPKIQLVNAIENLTVAQVDARWEAMARFPIEYVLSAGGVDPTKADPRSRVTKNGELKYGCDCTGAGAHGYGMPRKQKHFSPYGGWMNTDAIVADARGNQEVWELLDRPVHGCAIVFCGIDFDHDGDRERIGHFAYVWNVPASFDPKKPAWSQVTIYDCAGSNSKLEGAIGDVFKHPAGYFDGKATYRGETDPRWATIAVWCKNVRRP